MRATRSAAGSTRDGDGPLRRARGRDPRPVSRTRAPTTPAGCRCTSTINRPSRSVFISTRAIPNLLHDEITVLDHALTRPWSVDKTFARNPDPHPSWARTSCVEGNQQIVIGKENYFMSADGLLMPAKKDQPPPDLKYFKPSRKMTAGSAGRAFGYFRMPSGRSGAAPRSGPRPERGRSRGLGIAERPYFGVAGRNVVASGTLKHRALR